MRKKWGLCWNRIPCLNAHKGGKRIVPASRTPEGSVAANQPNGQQGVDFSQQPPSLPPHLLAPPSSPASFSNSTIPSTAQSPRCNLSLSANSPGNPSSTMYATGPYANDTRLITPPALSTFTTEPSTAPLTPPPELSHLTTPSSPDVPYAQFLSSSADLKCVGKGNYVSSNDFQNTYPFSPGSPGSRTSGDCLPSPWDASHSPRGSNYPRNASGWLTDNGAQSQVSNFFCPETFAQFYLDQPHSGGRLSISRELDVYSNGVVNQSKQNKNCKQEVEELEAYRASFGFSADEIITTTQYVEISDVMDDSFTMVPCTSNKHQIEEATFVEWEHGGSRKSENNALLSGERSTKSESDMNGRGRQGKVPSNHFVDEKLDQPGCASGQSTPGKLNLSDDDVFSNMGKSKKGRKSNVGFSCSDAEIEYRRGRSLRECRGDITWH